VADASPAPARLAEVVRSGFVEGVHRGSLVVLAADGSVALARGDVATPIFPRSANKLMQATGMVELGFPERDAMLALAAASHSGQPHHIEGVHRILADAGLDESALRTPADYPLDEDEKLALVRAGGVPDPVLMNCSGKHAAMLATCLLQGWPLEDYRDRGHPLQLHLAGTLERVSGERISITGVDGCGAPVSALSLTGLAYAYAAAVTAQPSAPERLVADAMRAHPQYVGGLGRDVTRFMRTVPGLLVKDGAEGVYAAALPDGRAFALKVDDGAARARPLVLAAWLAAEGFGGAELEALGSEPLLGGGERVGEIRVAADLFA
jgi:L-asparaginase II